MPGLGGFRSEIPLSFRGVGAEGKAAQPPGLACEGFSPALRLLLGCGAGWALEAFSKAFPCSAALPQLFQFTFWCGSVDEAMLYRRRAKFP